MCFNYECICCCIVSMSFRALNWNKELNFVNKKILDYITTGNHLTKDPHKTYIQVNLSQIHWSQVIHKI